VRGRNEWKGAMTGLPQCIVDERIEILRSTQTRGRFEAIRVRERARWKRRVGDLEDPPLHHQKRQ
jgi:hypothetical protein